MSEPPVHAWTERDGALLRLRLARPKANILDAAMIAALHAAFGAQRGNTGLRGVLIDHEGPHFSFGASIKEHLPAQCAQMLASLHAVLLEMLAWRAPILVAIRGQCLGGALELACAGNALFCAPDAQFGQPELKLGVFAPAASCLLPPRIGQARAEDLLISGRSIDAATALAWGLANEVAGDPASAALAYFDTHLAGKSAASLAFALEAVRAPLIEQIRRRIAAVETLYLEGLMQTHDAAEGLQAFLDKREPRFEHR